MAAFGVDTNNPAYSSVEGILFDKNETLLLQYPMADSGSYVVPSTVTTIGEWAFYGSSLTAIAIPSSVTNMDSAFTNCTSLVAINVDSNNPVYSSSDGVLFDKSQALLIQYPINKGGSYTVPTSVTTIGAWAFMNSTNLTSVIIAPSFTTIDFEAFWGSTLTAVTIPDSVTNIAPYAFGGTDLTDLTMLNGFEAIVQGEFSFCNSLTNVTIPGSVTFIGESAFQQCANLVSVTIPVSVTGIDWWAFTSCNRLKSSLL